MLKISNTKGTFHLPTGFTLEIEDTSPIYSSEGSQSTTATFPPTPQNFRLISHAHRLDASAKPLADDDRCLISDGYTTRIGSLNITDASTSQGITANIGFDESEAYRIWNAIKLRSLKLPVYAPEGGLPELVTYLEDILNERRTDTPFYIFTIRTSNATVETNDKKTSYPETLNQYVSNKGLHLYSTQHTETFCIDNVPVTVTVPAGYGLTAFLKVSYILEVIFSAYGYTIVENPFLTHHQLSRLVVLNNSADCCVKGTLNYSDLMPDCTINEFLQALYCRFGLVYFIDGNSRTVRLRLIRDIISAPPRHNFTKLHQAQPVISYQAPQQLRLSAATNITDPAGRYNAAPTAETLDQLLKPYNYIVSPQGKGGYLVYSPTLGQYILNGPYFKDRMKILSSDFFPWDRGSDCGYLEISSIDESLPQELEYETYLDAYYVPLYLVGKVHRYTSISSSTVELPENLNTSTPLCFCFSIPKQPNGKVPYGSVRCVGADAALVVDSQKRQFNIDLTFVGENGLFQRFWRGYDAILRHANHIIEGDFSLTHSELRNIDMGTPVNFDGQSLLPESSRYVLPSASSSSVSLRLRTLRLLQPYDLDKEQNVPIVPQLYKWVFFDNKDTVVNATILAQVNAWKKLVGGYPNEWAGTVIKNATDNAPDKVPYTVPSQAEYESGKQIYIQKVNYGFDLYYRFKSWSNNPVTGQPIYEIIEDGGVHYNVQYDLKLRADLL